MTHEPAGNLNAPGRDAMLFESHQARNWNCGLNIYLKVFLQRVDPPNGAANGDYPDWDTDQPGPRHNLRRQITRWGTGSLIFGPIATSGSASILGL